MATTMICLPVEESPIGRDYDASYIPAKIGVRDLPFGQMVQISSELAQQIYEAGGLLVARLQHDVIFPSGGSVSDYGYSVFSKGEHYSGSSKWSTATWDRYGPHTTAIFGNVGTSIDWFIPA